MSLLSKCKDTLVEFTNLANLTRGNQPKEPPTADESNPITLWFDIREKSTSAGPGLIWTVHNAFRKQDGKVLTALFFFATGSYQRPVGVAKHVSQKTCSNYIEQVTQALTHKNIINKYVRFPDTPAARHALSQRFYIKYGMPGIVGCIDGSHFKIVVPSKEEEHRYYSRKHYHSLNVQMQCSVFFFDKRESERLFKLKRKDEILIKMREGISRLQSGDFKQTLTVVHKLEEGPNTMAFATEPVMTSLHHIFAWYESMFDQEPVIPWPPNMSFKEGSKKPKYKRPRLQPFAKEYYFMEVEIRYGFLQIIDALSCLHYDRQMVHTNICPQNIIITRKGVWKLIGLEFLKPITTDDPSAMMPHEPFSTKFNSASQHNLDYSAPEVQSSSQINVLSDMFSFGMIIFAFYNNGKSLFEANDNPLLYLKQLETLLNRVMRVLPRMPIALQEAAERMMLRDPEPRPPTALLPLTKYFSSAAADPVIRALQGFNELKTMKIPEKIDFFKSVTPATIDQLPKKLRFPFVFDSMKPELRTSEGLAHGLAMIVYMIKDEPDELYTDVVYPAMKNVYTRTFISRNPLAVNAYLDAMHLFLSKCDQKQHLREEIIPILLVALENNDKTVLASAVECLMRCMEWLDDEIVLNQALPHIRSVLERHYNDLTMSLTVLTLFEKIMVKLDKQHLINNVVPSLLIMKLNDPTVMERIVSLYKIMVTDERLGLPHELMATKMLPSVAPHAVNKNMDQAQLAGLMEMLYHMLEYIEHEQRIVIEEYKNRPPSPPKNLARRQISIDEPAPAFCIPNLKVQRKVSSAEEMARKNSAVAPPPSVSTTSVTGNIRRISQWFFGSNNSTNSNNMNMGAGPSGATTSTSGNFLRVANLIPGRRLSDNTLMAPKIRIAPSCASSPGGTPGGSQAGLPTRRHSSIGPQERRGSHVNLSPPTAQHGRGRGAGSGSSLSVPAHSHPAGGSLPGSCTTYLDPTKATGSAQSVHSAQSALAARVAMSVRTTPTRARRQSGCPPSASSGAAAASLQGADFAQCGNVLLAGRI